MGRRVIRKFTTPFSATWWGPGSFDSFGQNARGLIVLVKVPEGGGSFWSKILVGDSGSELDLEQILLGSRVLGTAPIFSGSQF